MTEKLSAAVLFVTYICMEVGFVAGTVSGPTWRAQFGLTDFQLGLCLGAASAGVLLASLPVGHLTHRLGALRVMTIALTGITVSLALIFTATGVEMILLGLIGFGVSAAGAANGGVTFLSELFPDRMRRVMALASALWFGSSVLSAPAIGYWLDYTSQIGGEGWGFRVPFAMTAIMFGICLLLIRMRFGPRANDEKNPGENAAQSAQEPDGAGREWLWIPALGALHGLMLLSLMAWLNPMVQDVFGLSNFHGSLLFGVAALGIGSGRLTLAASSASSGWDDRSILALSALGGAVFFTAALLAPGYGMTLVLTGIGALCCSATVPCLFSLVAVRFPSIRSKLYGYMEASIAAAAMSGVFLIGLLSDRGLPLRAAMGLSPLAAALMATGALVWRLRKRPAPLDSPAQSGNFST